MLRERSRKRQVSTVMSLNNFPGNYCMLIILVLSAVEPQYDRQGPWKQLVTMGDFPHFDEGIHSVLLLFLPHYISPGSESRSHEVARHRKKAPDDCWKYLCKKAAKKINSPYTRLLLCLFQIT